MWTAFWYPAALASGVSRERFPPSAMRGEQKIPFLGICLGMQLAIVEFARNVAGMAGAHSAEIDPETPYPVIDLMPEQKDISQLGGTMRLGHYPCKLTDGSLAMRLYGEKIIQERHRHRYEVSNTFRQQLADAGLCFTGVSPDERIVEMMELPSHPFFLASQIPSGI